MADAMRDWLIANYKGAKSESPIESLFHAAWHLTSDKYLLPKPPVLTMGQQVRLGDYRADFMFTIRPAGEQPKYLVVEIDGHEFHERTKEQARKDKARDRWMTGAGYVVVRFTGSEVWANPFAVVAEVADRIHQLHYGMTPAEARAKAAFAAMRELLAD